MPNGESKKLNFVAKVWDAKANNGVGAYRPIYIAPDATNTVQGDVFLSDVANANLTAAEGMTAATPKAVNSVLSTANNKLDKTTTTAQSVASTVSFANTATFTKQVQGNGGFKGDLVGNASTATTLKTARTIKLDAGGASSTASFDGSSNIAISLSQVDASIVSKGTLPLSVIPQAALERLVKVASEAARYKLTTNDVQLGDSVLQTDTNVMYIVVDTANLANANGYQEYKAGSAASAETAVKLTNEQKFSLTGPVTASEISFNGTGPVALSTAITDGAVTSAKVNFNYAGSSSKGGPATSALTSPKLTTERHFSISGAVVASAASFDGTGDVILSTALSNKVVTDEKILDGAVIESKIADGAVTANKIANGAVTNSKIADYQVSTDKLVNASNDPTAPIGVTEGKIEDGAVTTNKIKDSNVTTAKIANYAVTLYKLDSALGTVTSGSSDPTSITLDDRYKLYGQTTNGALSAVYIRI